MLQAPKERGEGRAHEKKLGHSQRLLPGNIRDKIMDDKMKYLKIS